MDALHVKVGELARRLRLSWNETRLARSRTVDAVVIELENLATTLAAREDGWVLVPREPTSSMVISGFESAFRCEQSQDEDTQGTCKGAADIARVTYAAMIAAAPPAQVTGE